MVQFNEADLMTCPSCVTVAVPRVSTWHEVEGCVWVCMNRGCADYAAESVTVEDLISVGLELWQAELLTGVLRFGR